MYLEIELLVIEIIHRKYFIGYKLLTEKFDQLQYEYMTSSNI